MDAKDQLDLKAQEIIRETRAKISSLDDNSKDMMFREARSFNGWTDKPVSEGQLRDIYDLMKLCPTSSNACPIRIKFVCSEDAKKVLEPILFEPNRAKTMQAPAVAILGNDDAFYEHDAFLTPHRPGAMSKRMIENQELIPDWAMRNGSLQAAYFILAVRAVGLDAGPMQGLNKKAADGAYWAGTRVKTNFICSVGHGDETTVFKKLPRFDFKEVCEIL
ncbi:MAG: malonic semialdehyde reductase [Rhodospirillales bacterium]|nr:malonic semialdehyde reductase [Rhodospirillales bacterium]